MENINELKQQIQKLYGLIEASTVVISALEIDQVLSLVMEIAKRVVDAQASSLLILNSKTGLLDCQVALGEKGEEVKKTFSLKMGQGVAGWVAQKGEPLLVEDVEKDDRFFRGSDQSTGFKTQSILCVPMQVHGKVIGVLEAINPIRGGAFAHRDLELLSAFSSLAAIAIENARLTQEKLEQQALEQSLSIAKQIQDNFLKKEFPKFKKIEAFVKTRAAQEIGGDFYDLLTLGKGRWGVLIGDVSGRGIPASLYMVRTLSEFRLEAFSPDSISEMLEKLNDRLVKRATMGMFVTLLYLVIDTVTSKLEMANAGHLPLYIYRSLSKKIEKIPGGDALPLGILSRTKFPTRPFDLQKGDILLLVTDGLIEARNPHEEQFGWDRFEKCLSEFDIDVSPEKIVTTFFEALDRFCGSFAFPDDVTMVAVKYK